LFTNIYSVTLRIIHFNIAYNT